ncbi:MAG: HlyD family efflux transporter periplasmic adaptor subunit [Terracidiphilus sp.]|nr:HlyD family efflux transporter periplasmic adaptor subunit [Terracidiphilus sp.]
MRHRLTELWIKRRTLVVVFVLAAASAAVFGLVHYSSKAPSVPTFQVKRGEFLDALEFRGQLKAMKSVTMAAPSNAGDLQILKIATDGAQVKKGDAVVEFDPSKTEQDLKTDQSVLKSAQAEIEQARAQARLNEEVDTTAVMKAKYDVEVAKLDASKSEIVSRIEGAEAKLKVADAEQALHQAEEKLKSDTAVDQATIEDKKHASRKAEYDAQRAQTALASMTLKAPSDGTISLLSVWHNGSEGPYKAGERAWPGAAIAELPDVASLRIAARVDETERGRLAVSQPVTLQLDAIADRQFTGRIEHIGTLASSDFSSGWPIPRNFDLEIASDQGDPRLKPGMTVQITVIADRIADAITIPAQASFSKSGQTLAYVWNGSSFQERALQIERRSRDRILVSSGLKPGDLVALKDPTGKE